MSWRRKRSTRVSGSCGRRTGRRRRRKTGAPTPSDGRTSPLGEVGGSGSGRGGGRGGEDVRCVCRGGGGVERAVEVGGEAEDACGGEEGLARGEAAGGSLGEGDDEGVEGDVFGDVEGVGVGGGGEVVVVVEEEGVGLTGEGGVVWRGVFAAGMCGGGHGVRSLHGAWSGCKGFVWNCGGRGVSGWWGEG